MHREALTPSSLQSLHIAMVCATYELPGRAGGGLQLAVERFEAWALLPQQATQALLVLGQGGVVVQCEAGDPTAHVLLTAPAHRPGAALRVLFQHKATGSEKAGQCRDRGDK